MNILVTGVAGFIGRSVTKRLLEEGNSVVGIDNINDYYDPSLKFSRLETLGINRDDIEWKIRTKSAGYERFTFIRANLEDKTFIHQLFKDEKFDIVIHLAAQAGVRYSITHPDLYVERNICGFLNILEGCRQSKVSHLVYASSSSVYGLNGKVPFSEHDNVDHPVSLYAATKKSNELMAHAYSHIFRLPVTGLRFFTVYGPWGRPDMSPYLFIDGIINERPIKVFNNGDMWRDFTYIDDITEGIVRIMNVMPQPKADWDAISPDPASSSAPYRIYNIGNQTPTLLLDYIAAIEKATGKNAIKEMMPMQKGDVYRTYADSSELTAATGFTPSTCLESGISETVKWFREYYNKI